MTKKDWEDVLEESRIATEHLRQNLSVLSDVEACASQRLEEHHRLIQKSAIAVDEGRRLLNSLEKVRTGISYAEAEMSRLGRLVVGELVRSDALVEALEPARPEETQPRTG